MYCGIELKGSDLILVTIDSDMQVVDMPIKKITLEDPDDSDSVKFFANECFNLILNHNFSHIFIKSRAKKGKFAGGSDSFKMEGIIQYLATCPVHLISPIKLRQFEKTNTIEIPNLKKYQEGAFLTVLCGSNNL